MHLQGFVVCVFFLSVFFFLTKLSHILYMGVPKTENDKAVLKPAKAQLRSQVGAIKVLLC